MSILEKRDNQKFAITVSPFYNTMTKTYYIERTRKTISLKYISVTTVTIRIKSDEHLLKTRWNFNGCILIETEIHIFFSAPLRLTCMQHTIRRIVISGRIFIIIYILQGS